MPRSAASIALQRDLKQAMKALHKAVESAERQAQTMRDLVGELKRSDRRSNPDQIAADVIERIALAGYRSSVMQLPQRTLRATVRQILNPSSSLASIYRAARHSRPITESAFYRFTARVRQERRAMLGLTEPTDGDSDQDK